VLIEKVVDKIADDADSDASRITEILDAIPGAWNGRGRASLRPLAAKARLRVFIVAMHDAR
jgi:hypothetical protein